MYISCLICFKNMPHSNQEDMRGTSIICAHSSALLLRQSMLDYSSNSTGDFREATKNCTANLDSASGNLVRALQSWKRHGYADTMNQITTAVEYFWACAHGLHFESFPAEFINELVTLRSRINIANSVISRISSWLFSSYLFETFFIDFSKR